MTRAEGRQLTGYHTKSGFEAAVSLTKLAGGITGDPHGRTDL